MENITDDGNTSGKCINAAGPDGKYADFIFKGSSNPADKTDIDLKKYYRKIPVGESRWIRNYSLGTITFIDSDGMNRLPYSKIRELIHYSRGEVIPIR